MSLVIYHNPRCSKSRATLALLRERGVEPEVIEYLRTPPSAEELRRLLGLLGMTPRQLLRAKDAAAIGLDTTALDDEALLQTMAANPAAIERPIVVHGERAALGRPPERVLDIL